MALNAWTDELLKDKQKVWSKWCSWSVNTIDAVMKALLKTEGRSVPKTNGNLLPMTVYITVLTTKVGSNHHADVLNCHHNHAAKNTCCWTAVTKKQGLKEHQFAFFQCVKMSCFVCLSKSRTSNKDTQVVTTPNQQFFRCQTFWFPLLLDNFKNRVHDSGHFCKLKAILHFETGQIPLGFESTHLCLFKFKNNAPIWLLSMMLFSAFDVLTPHKSCLLPVTFLTKVWNHSPLRTQQKRQTCLLVNSLSC